MNRLLRICLLLALILPMCLAASAQLQRRSPRQMVKGGIMQRPDTLARPEVSDSLLAVRIIDSLRAVATDSLKTDSLLFDSLLRAARIEMDTLAGGRSSVARWLLGVDSLLANTADSLRADITDSLIDRGVLDSLAQIDTLLDLGILPMAHSPLLDGVPGFEPCSSPVEALCFNN